MIDSIRFCTVLRDKDEETSHKSVENYATNRSEYFLFGWIKTNRTFKEDVNFAAADLVLPHADILIHLA
jgi:hypothetical protein